MSGWVDAQRILRVVWRDKMHVEPQALELSPRHVSERYETIWAPTEALIEMLSVLPAGMLALWRDAEAGHVVLTYDASRYAPGPQPWRHGALPSVCYLSVTDLLDDRRRALETWLRLLDHLLGSGAVEGGGWFSRGAGLTPKLEDAAQRFVQIEALGYGHRELQVDDPGGYFARTLALYVEDHRRLSVLDPLVHKLYASTLMDDRFWESD